MQHVAASLIKPAVSSLAKSIFGRAVRRAGFYGSTFLVLLHPNISNIEISKFFHYKPRFNDVFSRDNIL